MSEPFALEVSEPLRERMRAAREDSWSRLGKRVVFYLPGMFNCHGARGLYPAVSITGPACRLNCDHCRGRVLGDMTVADTPEKLIEAGTRFARAGMKGCLISGGSTAEGTLPWDRFLGALAHLRRNTDLILSIHSGLVDERTARALKEAGVDQALMDVVGSAETLREVCHLPPSLDVMERSLDALFRAGLDVVPHVVVGLHHGALNGETRALEMIARHRPSAFVFVVLMPLKGTPMEGVKLPPHEEIAELFVTARTLMPDAEISLGCARPRTPSARLLEILALDTGMNRLALPSDIAADHAVTYGLEIVQRSTCCSVPWKES